MLMRILQLSGRLLSNAFSSVALQLDCKLISEYHIVKRLLLLDVGTTAVKPLSFVSFTNHLTISCSCASLGLFLSETTISDLGNNGVLATTIGDFASQLLCG